MDGRPDGPPDGRTDDPTKGLTDGQTPGRMLGCSPDGWTDRQKSVLLRLTFALQLAQNSYFYTLIARTKILISP